MMHQSTAVLAAMIIATPTLAQDEGAQAVGAALGGIIGLIIIIITGALVGWLASLIVKGSGSGFWADVLIGIGGSIIAGYLLPLLGVSLGGAAGSLIAAVIGAVILILIVRAVRKSS